MMSSRGMGAIRPSKMPRGKRVKRRDDTDFTEYAGGGAIWDQPRPKSLGKSKELSAVKKDAAKSRARRAGRPYPNFVDNVWAARD